MAKYGVPMISLDHNGEDEELDFVTFNTSDEKEAEVLAKCITGNPKYLAVLDENGTIWSCK